MASLSEAIFSSVGQSHHLGKTKGLPFLFQIAYDDYCSRVSAVAHLSIEYLEFMRIDVTLSVGDHGTKGRQLAFRE